MTVSQDKLVVLDRDGVINVDVPGRYICNAAEWIPIDGSLEAIGQLTAAGFDVYVVSNQSGIGRGLYSEADLAAMHAKLLAGLERHGSKLAGWFYCPHTPADQCSCRKPATGMLEAVAQAAGRALDGCAFIGDKWSDLVAARRMRMRAILVGTGHGQATLAAHSESISEYFSDLGAAANALIHGSSKSLS